MMYAFNHTFISYGQNRIVQNVKAYGIVKIYWKKKFSLMQSDFIAFSLLHNEIIPIHSLIAVSALGPNFVLYDSCILLKVNKRDSYIIPCIHILLNKR